MHRVLQTEELKLQIGTRIEALRTAKNLTRKDFFTELLSFLSESLQYSFEEPILSFFCATDEDHFDDTLEKIEKGDQFPPISILVAIHGYFKISIDKIIFGESFYPTKRFEEIYNSLSEEDRLIVDEDCIEQKEELGCFDDFKEASDDSTSTEISYEGKISERFKCVLNYLGCTSVRNCSERFGSSKNTYCKYRKDDFDFNRASDFFIRFCYSSQTSLDYLINGTYYDKNFPVSLSGDLACYNYSQQLKLLDFWKEEAELHIPY